jgi:RNA polymerase sigma-70 factor (ECF subfamily)
MRAALESTTTPERQLSDEVLIARILQGDAPALDLLYDRHAPMVLGIALRITGDRALAERVLQETFWRIWRRVVTDESRSESPSGWLFRIARSLALEAADNASSKGN